MIPARDGTYIVRVAVPAGWLDSDSLRSLAEAAEMFGDGEVHLTVRQGVEIHGVPGDKVEEVLEFLRERGLEPGSTGSRVRQITACPGSRSCIHGLRDSRPLAERLHVEFHGVWTPAKVKIAIAGCPRGCPRPEANDLGVVAVEERQWRVLVGGKSYVTVGSSDEVVKVVDEVLEAYSRNASPGVRLRSLVRRLGLSFLRDDDVGTEDGGAEAGAQEGEG